MQFLYFQKLKNLGDVLQVVCAHVSHIFGAFNALFNRDKVLVPSIALVHSILHFVKSLFDLILASSQRIEKENFLLSKSLSVLFKVLLPQLKDSCFLLMDSVRVFKSLNLLLQLTNRFGIVLLRLSYPVFKTVVLPVSGCFLVLFFSPELGELCWKLLVLTVKPCEALFEIISLLFQVHTVPLKFFNFIIILLFEIKLKSLVLHFKLTFIFLFA